MGFYFGGLVAAAMLIVSEVVGSDDPPSTGTYIFALLWWGTIRIRRR